MLIFHSLQQSCGGFAILNYGKSPKSTPSKWSFSTSPVVFDLLLVEPKAAAGVKELHLGIRFLSEKKLGNLGFHKGFRDDLVVI